MAAVTAQGLRALARQALEETGARGFVRFAPEGDGALLLTDAPRSCENGERLARLVAALESRGFGCARRGNLLALTPEDALLLRLAQGVIRPSGWDWESPLAPARALADRWLRKPDAPLTAAGRRLALETARLLWRPRAQALAGLDGLRALAAAMQREGDQSGFALCGDMLANWCALQENEHQEGSD